MRKDRRLILALDETDREKALHILDEVSPYVDAVKINWPLVLSVGPDIINELSRQTDVICDFKVADIPNTVSLIVSQSVARGAAAVIVHAFPGSDSIEAAVQASGKAEIYAVTEMSHPGALTFTAPHAEEMARMALACGVDGFIAPATRPDRLRSIRALVGDKKILSPGVGVQGGSATAALQAGATYVIVGRAIYAADDPRAVAERLANEIEKALR